MIAGCGTTVNGVQVATLNCVFPLIATLIFWALILAGSVAVIFIIIAGIRYITSGGDAKKLESARQTFVFAVIGLFLIFLSFFIVKTIGEITGVACIDPSKPLTFETCY